MFRANEPPGRSLEELLAEFELRQPRPLLPAVSSAARWLRVAAAVLLGVSCTGSCWLLLRGPAAEPAETRERQTSLRSDRLSAIALTHLALENPARFESELSEVSRSSLPSFRRLDSAVPAKD